MKKIINVVVLFFAVGSMAILSDYDYDIEELNDYESIKKTEWQDEQPGNQFFFNGFNFKEYDPDKDIGGLQLIIKSEAKHLSLTYFDRDKDTFSFVGYSQGGLRALSTSAWLKANDPELYDKLDAVITVSGIDQGLRALRGGVPFLKANLNHDYLLLKDGAIAALRATDGAILILNLLAPVTGSIVTPVVLVPAIEFYFFELPYSIDGAYTLFTSLNIMPELAYIAYAFEGREMKEINDMVPGSTFINDTLVKYDGTVELMRMADGYKTVRKIGWVTFLRIPLFPYVYYARVPKYKLVEVPKTSGTFRIDEELPIGYIVGLNWDTLSMAENEGKDIRETLNKIVTVLEVAKNIHSVKNLFAYGFFTGSPQYYYDASRAANYIRNIDHQLNNLKGSPENDGLVALESQYFPKTIHTNVLLGGSKGYVEFPEYNHQNINPYDKNKPNKVVQAKIGQMLEMVEKQRKK